ncbi:hypothetical protein BJX63DRAFT_421752 [Aspergillus granulosus]|uniref:Zn(2)-C6 fungal-type domain-containing protein n=1 Tax=Aspergillus granulosus TaxID=176169 RepID=A0ABR4HBC7_9EURO
MGTSETEKRVQCPSCATTFGHRSSLIRHLRKKCNRLHPQNGRRKACTQCVTTKTRCSLERPSCSRCALRQIPCEYPTPDSSATSPLPEGNKPNPPLLAEARILPQATQTAALPEPPVLALSSSSSSASFLDTFFPPAPCTWDFSLTGGINSLVAPRRDLVLNGSDLLDTNEFISDISNMIVPAPKRTLDSALLNHSMEFIFRVLRSWPRMLADEFRAPPLIHHTHVADGKRLPVPLANCFTLVKMWHGRCQGSEEMVHRLIKNEANTLLTRFKDLNEPGLLAVLQAVVLYAIILLFPTEGSPPTIPETNLFRKIQDLVHHASSTGVFLQEERDQLRPAWSTWIHVTSKRRALLALYRLQWAYSVFYDIPSYECRELGSMPAPAAKILWLARTEQEWNSQYIKWLARWSGEGYLQWEFDRIRPGIKMEHRAERWLEETDEFGMVMMSIEPFEEPTTMTSPGKPSSNTRYKSDPRRGRGLWDGAVMLDPSKKKIRV